MASRREITKPEQKAVNAIVNNVHRSIMKAIDQGEYTGIESFCNLNGFSKSIVYQMISGEKVPTVLTLVRIAQALDISFDQLVGE